MEQRFQNQTAIVTGGASGLGKAIAERIASEGGHVAIFDLVESECASVENALRENGWKATARSVDVTDEGQVAQAMQSVSEEQGRIDIVINCAGIVGPTSTNAVDVETEAFDQTIAVNLKGSFLVTKHALRHMLPHDYGRILLIASVAGKEGNAGMSPYSASKAGVIGLVKSIGKEYAETGVTLNGLAPAVVQTAMIEATDPEQVKYMTDKIPMKRLGKLEEVASLAAWIVSPEASFNTAFTFDLTGGRATY